MTRGTLIDANLLCLLAVGRSDRGAIAAHARLRAYGIEDLELVGAIIDRVGDPVLCPHVLAETSNLLAYRQAPGQQARWRASLAHIVALATERTRPASQAVVDGAFLTFGMTDAILLMLAADRHLALVSDDLMLCLEAERRGARTINYNHVRFGALRLDQL